MRRIGIIRIEDGDTTSFKMDVYDVISGEFIARGISPLSHRADACFLNLALNMLSFRVLTLPFSDKKRINEVVPFELQGAIVENIDDIVFDSVCLGRNGNGFNVLVVYVNKAKLASIIETLQRSGIDPVIAGSIEVSNLLKETADPNLITRRLLDFWSGGDRGCEVGFDLKEELRNPTINLRKGDLAFKGDTLRLTKAYRVMTILLIILAIVINIDLCLKIVKERRDINSIKRESRKVYAELFPSEKRITDEYHQLKAHLREARERTEITGGVPALDLLLHLTRIRTGGIIINEIGLSTEGLSIKGEALSMDEMDRFKTGLSKMLLDVNASDVKPVSGRFSFTISGRLKR